jgi:hypothetical protein
LRTAWSDTDWQLLAAIETLKSRHSRVGGTAALSLNSACAGPKGNNPDSAIFLGSRLRGSDGKWLFQTIPENGQELPVIRRIVSNRSALPEARCVGWFERDNTHAVASPLAMENLKKPSSRAGGAAALSLNRTCAGTKGNNPEPENSLGSRLRGSDVKWLFQNIPMALAAPTGHRSAPGSRK